VCVCACVYFLGGLVLILGVAPQKKGIKAAINTLVCRCEEVKPVRVITNKTNY
jgi:hypothetical protein